MAPPETPSSPSADKPEPVLRANIGAVFCRKTPPEKTRREENPGGQGEKTMGEQERGEE